MKIIKQIALAALLSYTSAVQRHHHHHHSHGLAQKQKRSLDDATGEAELKMMAHDQELLKKLRATHEDKEMAFADQIDRTSEYTNKAFDNIDKSKYAIDKEIKDA